MSSSILESKWEVLARNVLFLGASSTPGWKMTSVGEKAGLLGKKKCHLLKNQLVFPGVSGTSLGANWSIREKMPSSLEQA